VINYDVWKEKFGTCVCIKDGIVSDPFDHPYYEAPALEATAAIIFHSVSPYLHCVDNPDNGIDTVSY